MSLYAGDYGEALPITLTTSQAADVARFVVRYRPTSSGAVVTWDLTPSSSTATTVSFVRVLEDGDMPHANASGYIMRGIAYDALDAELFETDEFNGPAVATRRI